MCVEFMMSLNMRFSHTLKSMNSITTRYRRAITYRHFGELFPAAESRPRYVLHRKTFTKWRQSCIGIDQMSRLILAVINTEKFTSPVLLIAIIKTSKTLKLVCKLLTRECKRWSFYFVAIYYCDDIPTTINCY